MRKFLAGLLAGVLVAVSCLYGLGFIEAARPSWYREVAVDGGGNLLLIEYLGSAVTKVAAEGGYAASETIGQDAFKNAICTGVDGAGDLFVADSDGNAIREIVAAEGTVKTLAASIAIGPPCSLAIDGSGNIFVFEFRGVKEIVAEGGYATVKPLFSGQIGRNGGALDAGGNVFFLDGGAVKELTVASGYTALTPIASGVYTLNGSLAIDTAGDLFIATDDEVKEIPAAGGYAEVKTLIKGRYYFPTGKPVDRNGNLIVVDYPNRRVIQLMAGSGYSRVVTLAVPRDGLAYQAKMFLERKLGIGTTQRTIVAATKSAGP